METATLDKNVYFLLLLGMVAVGAHAYSLFNQPIDRPSVSTRWRFLSTIPIELSTTQSRFRLGLVLYVIVFELIYLVLSSSSSLLLMTYQMSGRQDLTGALSESVSPNSTVPILASTAIILLTQIRPLSQLELMLRRFAHRMARVPDGLKMVKQRTSSYLRNTDLLDSAIIDAELAGIEAMTDPRTARRLKRSQTVTSWLFENTLGATGSMAWDEEGSEELLQLFQPVKYEMTQLSSDILAAARPSKDKQTHDSEEQAPETQTQGPWQDLLNRAFHLEERLTLLLCLLIINQPQIDTKDEHALKYLIEHTRRREKSEVSDISIKSCLLGSIISLFALFFYESGESLLRQDIKQSPYTAKAPYGDYLDARIRSNTDSAELYLFDGLTLAERQDLTISGSIRADLQTAFNETLWTAITFLCTVFIVLSMNTRNIQLWHSSKSLDDSEPVTPSISYLLITLSATVTTAGALFVYLFITQALLPALHRNIDVLSYEIMGPFGSMLPSILRYSLAAAITAIFVIWLDGTSARRRSRAMRQSDREPNRFSGKSIMATLMATPARVWSNLWLACVSAAASIAVLVLATSIAAGHSPGWIEASDQLLSAFIAFLCFLLVLTGNMKKHPHRYVPSLSETQIDINEPLHPEWMAGAQNGSESEEFGTESGTEPGTESGTEPIPRPDFNNRPEIADT